MTGRSWHHARTRRARSKRTKTTADERRRVRELDASSAEAKRRIEPALAELAEKYGPPR